MARIYLISPGYENVYQKVKSESLNMIQPSLGIAYIASYVQERGHSVKLFESSVSDDVFRDISLHLKEFNPDYVGITATTPQITAAFQIAEYIKKIDKSKKIILGGYHVSALPDECLENKNIDIVVCGEGELATAEILDGMNLKDIQGISYREGEEVKVNGARPLIEDLDALPFPLWEQLPVESYYTFPDKGVTVMSGRGCPYRCQFCASGVINQNRYRVRSPENFVDELDYLYRKFNVNFMAFEDETFTIDYKRVEKVCALIVERKLPIRWTCMSRASNLSKAILKTMKDAGCVEVGIGIESADENMLKKINKRITLKQVTDVVSWANELKVKVRGFFILGLPHETRDSIEKTAAFSKSLKTDFAHFCMFVPLPGSPAWDIVKEGKILRCTTDDWSQFTRFDKAIVESDYLSADELTKYHRKMVREYFLSPSYIYRKLRSVESLNELKEYFKGAMILLKTNLSDIMPRLQKK